MNSQEREEIERLPYKYRPLGAWAYFGYSILFNIPVVGFIVLIIFALSSDNINKRSFARSYFCGFIIAAIVITIILLIAGTTLLPLLKDYLQNTQS